MNEARTIQAQTIKRDLEADGKRGRELLHAYETSVALYHTSGSLLEQTNAVVEAKLALSTFGDEMGDSRVLDDFVNDVECECSECESGDPAVEQGMCVDCLRRERQGRP